MTFAKLFPKCTYFLQLITFWFMSLPNGSVADFSMNSSLLNNSNDETLFSSKIPALSSSMINFEPSLSTLQISSNPHISVMSPVLSLISVETDSFKSSEVPASTKFHDIISSKMDNSLSSSFLYTPHSVLLSTSQILIENTVDAIYKTKHSSSILIKHTISFTNESLQQLHPVDIHTTPLFSTLIKPTKATSTSTLMTSSFLTYFKINEEIYSFTESTLTSTSSSTLELHKARYFLSFKSEDCPPINTNKLNRELLKTLSSLGVLKVSADITRSECQTSLNVNITVTATHSAILKLQESKSQNLTVFIFNRAFEIIDIQKIDIHQKNTKTNSTLNPINIAARNELKAYVAVGGCFGLVVLVCITVCCLKYFTNGPRKRLRFKNNHTPLTPEDYTLTPIPRPTSLYVDYYRNNSLTGDLYSTTSAGSVGSTSPTGEAGVIQPFDTSIVPLEDTDPLQQSSNSKKNSVSPCDQNNAPKVSEIVTMDGLIYCNQTTDSTEKLNPGHQRKYAGVKNPLYSQKY